MRIFFVLIICIIVWSIFIEPSLLNVNYYSIKDEQLKGLRIVSLADIHPQPNQKKRVKEIVEKSNSLNPDFVFLLGDYVYGYSEKDTLPIDIIAKELSLLKSKYGTFAILGNHDWWVNGHKISQTLSENKIKVIYNGNTKVKVNNNTIYIAGVEDYDTRNPSIEAAMFGTKKPIILLTHNPDLFPKVPNEVNLTLSGHTHGGQVTIPLLGALFIPSKYGKKYASGLVIENHRKMIISKGLGNSILPIRFNCLPEIVVVDFI